MVEAGLRDKGRTFTPNDCFVGDQERLWLVTGWVTWIVINRYSFANDLRTKDQIWLGRARS